MYFLYQRDNLISFISRYLENDRFQISYVKDSKFKYSPEIDSGTFPNIYHLESSLNSKKQDFILFIFPDEDALERTKELTKGNSYKNIQATRREFIVVSTENDLFKIDEAVERLNVNENKETRVETVLA